MFRMSGNKVELYRYAINYNDNGVVIEYCISEEHRDELQDILTNDGIEFVTENINQTNNEWIDGLEFDSYDKALDAFNIGESNYKPIDTIKIISDKIKELQNALDIILGGKVIE